MKIPTFVIGFILVASLVLGTEPTPPPYQRFTVDGSVVRPLGKDLGGIGIILLGRMSQGSSYYILRGRNGTENSVAVTDPNGVFFLTVSSWEHMDSLTVAAIIVDKPTTTSQPFYVDSALSVTITEQYTTQSSGGCSSCVTNSEVKERVAGYSYSFSNKVIQLAY